MARIVLALLLITLVVLQFQLWTGEGSLAEIHRLETKLESIRQANASQRADNQTLAARIQELQSGTAVVERLARSQLGLVRENETFFLAVDAQANPPRSSADTKLRLDTAASVEHNSVVRVNDSR